MLVMRTPTLTLPRSTGGRNKTHRMKVGGIIAKSPHPRHPIAVVVDVQGLTFRTIHLPNDAALCARNRRDACIETYGDDHRFEGDVRYLAWLLDKIEEFPDGFLLALAGGRCVGHLELEVPY